MHANEGRAKSKASRREFLGAAASTAFAFSLVPSGVLGRDAPSNKLNVAAIGAGGRGAADLRGVARENIVALCDVDLERAAGMIGQHPEAKVYRDFRVMLDELDKQIDAVIVATPDHTHYVAAMAALERGKHVYCEKPLAHSVEEVRRLTAAARRRGVATQMGNQGHSSEDIRLTAEWVWDGRLGEVREVWAWSDRPAGGYPFPASLPRPADTPPVPETLNWDLWLGPAAYRPYHPLYAPIYWRGWLDFGTGALGDMGCHILDPAFWALKLGAPSSVEANVSYNPDPRFWIERVGGAGDPRRDMGKHMAALRGESYPAASVVRYEFPARGDMPPLTLTWCDGGLLPPPPKGVADSRELGTNGALLIGDEGVLLHGSHGAGGARLLPDQPLRRLPAPPRKLERVPGHHQDWINACKTGKPASSNFDYGGPLTELVLLGVVAMRVPDKKLLWDAQQRRFTNSEEANALLAPAYRDGWTL